MTDTRAEDALRQQASMEAERSNLDSHCQEVAERVLTRQRDFTTTRRIGGEKLNEKVFDSTAPLALERFGAAIESMLTPRTQTWHELTFKGMDKSRPDEGLKQVLSALNKALFAARYAPGANFASQAHETYMGLGAFGNGAIFVDEDRERLGLRYRSIPFAQCFWAENFQGQVDTVHRKFELTARQFKQMFGEDELPETIRTAAEKEPGRKFELIHCVRPREDADWSKADYRGMRYASYYVSYEGRKLLREGGYRSMRYACCRYVMAPREVYGRGPAMTVLADIKSVNEQQKTLLRTGQLVTDLTQLAGRYGLEAAQELIAIKQRGEKVPLSGEELERWRGELGRAMTGLDAAVETSPLPDEPPQRAVAELDAWLQEVRRVEW